MKIIGILLLLSASAVCQLGTINGTCQVGDVFPVVQGLSATTPFIGSYPQCTVTIYLTGTTTKATIYSTATATPLGNPFTANADGTWLVWSLQGVGVDVVTTGGNPYSMPATETLTNVFPSGTGGNPGALSGVLYPATCGGVYPPSWCSGTDIGGWVNSAIAALPGHCGSLYIPTSSTPYSSATTIVKPRCVKLNGAGQQATVINWTPSSGTAIIVADGQGSVNYPNGQISDLTLSCATGSASPTIGIYYGGSTGVGNAPSTILDPGTNYGDHDHLNRVKVIFCGTNIQIGNNAWADIIDGSTLTSGGTNWYFPSPSLSNSGEAMAIYNSDLINATGNSIQVDSSGNGLLDLEIAGGRIDYNIGWAIQLCQSSCNQGVHLYGVHLEQPAKWIQNFGYLTVVGSKLTNGTSSGTLGYLIDNQDTNCAFLGAETLNAGAGTIFRGAGGQQCTLVQLSWSGPGLGLSGGYAQNPAFWIATGALGGSFIQSQGFVANTGTTCGGSNVALGAGWGTGATATSFLGYSQSCQFTITTGSAAFGAAPTVTFTLPNQFAVASVPCQMNVHAITGGGGAIIFDNTTPSPSAPVFTAATSTGAAFTPAGAETYKVVVTCGP